MKRIFTIMASAALVFVGCQEKTGGGEGGNGSVEGNVEVKTKLNRTSVLHNPLNGWVMYVSASADPSYFDTKFYNSELGSDVLVRDYASACYIRTGWKTLNPEEGVYAWEQPESKIYKLIERAEELDLPIAFRVVVDGRDQRENTPMWVFEKPGAKFCYLDGSSKYPDRKTPLAMDPVWRAEYEKFVEAFGKRFNNAKTTAFIDGYGLGKWGEGHNVCYEMPDAMDGDNKVSDNTREYKANTMEWITSLYARHFTEVPLVINYHRQIGHPVSSGKEAQPDSETVLAIALKNGYCLRSDAFGMNNQDWGYNNWERGYVNSKLYQVPVIMEGGWIVSSHSYWNDSEGYRKGHPEDVRQGEYNASREAHVNMMDFRVGGETESWFKDSFKLVQQFVQEGGYRLYPDVLSLPDDASAGSRVTIQHRWRNIGWGYFPNNIRQWNYKYKVAFALLDASDKAVKLFFDEKCEPSEWRQGTPAQYEFNAVLDVPAGDYTWGVAIVDTSDGDKPAIRLAVNDVKTSDGWVKLCGIKVR